MSGGDTLRWQRKFAWRPIWLHVEQPPLRLGRMVWLRWYECRAEYRLPAPTVEQVLANRLHIIWAETGVAFAALVALTVLLLAGWKI